MPSFPIQKDARNSHLRQDFFAELNGCETLRRKPQSWDPLVLSPEISGIQVDRVIAKSWETTTEFEHPKKNTSFFFFFGGVQKTTSFDNSISNMGTGPSAPQVHAQESGDLNGWSEQTSLRKSSHFGEGSRFWSYHS